MVKVLGARHWVAYGQMTCAMLLIGSLFVVSKVIVQSIPVFVASFLRQFLAFVALALWLYAQKSPLPQIHQRDYWVLFIQGFVGIFLFSVFALYGLRLTNAIDANIITSTTPLSMMLIAVLLLGERLTARRMGALGLALLGTLAINVLGTHEAGTRQEVWLGNALVVLAVLAEGVFFGFGKLLKSPISSTWLSLILTGIGSVLFFPFAAYSAFTSDLSQVSGFVWGLVLYTGVALTAFGVVLMNRGLQQVPASTASIFTALMPVSGVVLSVVFLRESFHWYHALGMVLVLLAMMLVMSERKAPLDAPSSAY